MTKARAINDQEKMHGSAGYIPKRNEFEYEWLNECETSIGDMEFNEDVRPCHQPHRSRASVSVVLRRFVLQALEAHA